MEEAKFKMGKADFNKLEQDYYDLLSSWLINLVAYAISLNWLTFYQAQLLKHNKYGWIIN
jgi:hypothetical protein